MRPKSMILASTSFLILAGAAPAFAQTDATVAAQDPAAAAADATVQEPGEETIVVTGIRQALQSSQAQKRNSDQIVDSIVAEDIGKLPDITASAALARVTGVQVNRGAGEAANVQVRGLPDISTTYNGREIFTAELRNVAIQDFPAGAVQALEVYKSSTANLIEGGIGGQVNVRSRRPFDFDGFHISGSLHGVHWEQSQKIDYNGNLLISNRWDTGIGEIGVLVNGAITNIDYLDSTRENDRWITPEPNVAPGAGDFTRPNGQGIYYSNGNRWRPSVNAALQWRPSPNLEFYVDGLFQGFRSEDYNHWLFVPTYGAAQFTNVVLRDGSQSVQSMTVTNAANPDGWAGTTRANTDTYQIAGGGIWTSGGLKITADVAYTDSRYDERGVNIDYAYTSSPVRNVNFDIPQGPGGGTFDFVNFNPADARNYAFRGLFDRVYMAAGDDIQARVDAQYETGMGFLNRIDIGIRYNDRNATRRNGQRYQPLLARGLLYADLPVEIGHYPRGFRFDNYQTETLFAAPTFDSIVGNVEALQAIAGFSAGDPPFSDVETFVAKEKALAGYAQVRYAFDAGAIPIDGNVGVRGVRTQTTLSGTSNNNGVFTPVSQDNEYTDWLPNASLRARLTESLQLRLAYTQTRTRPNFGDLNPSTTYGTPPSICTPVAGDPTTGPDAPNCRVFNSTGNPNLLPIKSTNYDLSLEWYFSRTGSLTGALFRRDVRNFVFRNDVTQEIAGAPDVVTNLPTNAGRGRIQGAEVAFTSFLDIESFPEWAKSFGMQANYTYIDASTELQPSFRAQLPGQQDFPGVSKHAFNLVGFYERPTYSARLAYNWRGDFITEYQNLQANFVSPLYQDSYGTLDFSATITPIPNVTIAFDALNLLATPIKTYRAYNSAGDIYPFQVKYIERVYSLGARFRF